MNNLILTEVNDNIGIITFNNPSKKNALNSELLLRIVSALQEFESQQVRAVIIRAEKNAKVWSAGHDIDELPLNGIDPLGQEKPLEQALNAIQIFPAPVIAMVEGSVWGGACDLAITCDMVIGSPVLLQMELDKLNH